ncbi:hypothetical protein B0H19DRAFT_1153429 [Mycena capillaripes]|nr:hypothetical protein B0H19DRAFT_1153429 [Mycena capillaripes]
MCDTVPSAVLFWALTSISETAWHYVSLASALTWLAFYTARRQGPAGRFRMLEDVIKVTEGILERAKATCERNHIDLIDGGCRLLQVKFSASMIQSQILEMRNATWKTYFTDVKALIRAIDQCASEVKAIQTLMLLIIEKERQRKLTEGIKDSQEFLNAVLRSPTRRAYLTPPRTASDSNIRQYSYNV